MRYGNQGAIIPGRFADITVFDNDYKIRYVMINGKILKGDKNEIGNSPKP
jgi:N-acetylglucosamine-6-phosphate deacetylase